LPATKRCTAACDIIVLNTPFSGEAALFCEDCGLQFLPKESVCSRCGSVPTRQWLQLTTLLMLMVTFACNSLVDLYLLRRLVAGRSHSLSFRAWAWFNQGFSSYGWVVVALSLLIWSIWSREDWSKHITEWVTRGLLILLLLAGTAAALLPHIPGRRAAGIRAVLSRYHDATMMLPWGIVALVAGLLCLNTETRDSLLGRGKLSTLISAGILLMVLTMILQAWSATFR